MKLHLIRHGRTLANEKHLYCGHTDISLSEKGKMDLLVLKNRVDYPKGDFFITSGLKRCRETLEILYDKSEDFSMAEWMEMNFGVFEMKSYEELKNRKDYKMWIQDVEKNKCPLGESQTIFLNRIQHGWIQLKEICPNREDANILVITHGGVIANSMELLFPKEKNFYEWQPKCGRGYSIELIDKKLKYQVI
ncbi:MAG: histidine phosphatase family protein [Acetivibrio sp.]